MGQSKIEQQMSGQHHQAIKNKSSKTEGTIEGFWTKTVASPLERKKQREEIDKQSGSNTNENTTAIVIVEESKYYY